MKKFIFTVLFILGHITFAVAQSINLKEILNQAYSKPSDFSVIKGQEIDYIVPPHLDFIDTNITIQTKMGFSLAYFKDLKSFERRLKKVHNVSILSIDYNTIYENALEITLEVSKTTDTQYFGRYKFFTFIDKRRIKLMYNKEKGTWVYNSLIRLWDEPKVGQE